MRGVRALRGLGLGSVAGSYAGGVAGTAFVVGTGLGSLVQGPGPGLPPLFGLTLVVGLVWGAVTGAAVGAAAGLVLGGLGIERLAAPLGLLLAVLVGAGSIAQGRWVPLALLVPATAPVFGPVGWLTGRWFERTLRVANLAHRDVPGEDGPVATTAPPPIAAANLSRSQLSWLMGGLLLGLFLSSTEQSVVATALPTMAGELGAANRIAWVVSAYLLTSTITTPLYGKMSDLFGRRIVYQTSIAVFVVGSALCALSQSINQLVAARAVQGLGGGGLMSLAFVIVGDVVSPRERGRWIGLFTTVFTVSAITGPLWGGLLVDGVGWRWIFWAVVPVALVALVVTNRGLRLPFATRQRPIDWLGIALLVVASTGLILVPIWGGEAYGWTSWQLMAAGAVGVVGTVLFVAQERRAAEPIIPLRLFGDRTVVAIFIMGFCLMASLLSVTTFMPLFLQVATGVTATRSGLMMIPQSIGISLMATIGGLLVSRTGRYKWTMLVGGAVAAGGMALLTRIGPDTGALDLAPTLFILGVGLGLIFPNLTLSVQNAAGVEDLGIATSTSNFFRSMGGAFGAAVAGAMLTRKLDDELVGRLGAARLAELGGAEGLVRTPKVVHDLPDELRRAVVEAVANSVVWVIILAIPLLIFVWLVALTVKETPLRTNSALGGGATPPE